MGLACTRSRRRAASRTAGNHSCAVDLAVLARALLDEPRIARIVRRRQAILPFPIKGGRLYLYNHNPLLRQRLPRHAGDQDGVHGRRRAAASSSPRARRHRSASCSCTPPTRAARPSSSSTAGSRSSARPPLGVGPPVLKRRAAGGRMRRLACPPYSSALPTGQSAKGATRGSQRHARAGRVPPEGARLARGAQGARRPRRAARAPAPRTTRTSTRAARWQGQLAEGGLAGVTWPDEFGGQGLGPIEQVIVNQEIARAGVPGHPRRHRRRHARPDDHRPRHRGAEGRATSGPMLHGDEVWCQLFSEPAAGSDLAAVQTRARQRGRRHWVLNGQKVWTTNAQFAAYGLLLARTDPDVPKHKGLTMFVAPDGRARASPSAACARSRARPSSTRSSSTTCACRPTPSSARSTTAGARR